MPVTSTNPTSRRGYLSQSELEQYANITITDQTEADDVISQAEELIDAFVGFQDKFMNDAVSGYLTATNGTTSHTLDTEHLNAVGDNYYIGCEIEIVGGTGAGQRRKVTASTYAGVVTTEAFTTALDTTSYYVIRQLGKFPRSLDVYTNSDTGTTKYFKSIPEAIKRATASQVQYIQQMGDAYFASDRSDKESESIGDYSYTKGAGATGLNKLVSPKTRLYLRGIINNKGIFIP